jgi:quercetin dioxygenase-like cupin family protein
MNFRCALLILSLAKASLGASVFGQEPKVLPLESEPHHHLALQNEYVKVYQVEVAPGDAVKLHRHDTDAISLSLSDSLVTVHFPGKPDVQQKLTNGQIRLQARGYVHSTAVEGNTPFRNVTVELLKPQTGERNGCAQVIANQPLNCAAGQGVAGSAGHVEQMQFESEQTSVILVRLPPHNRVGLSDPGNAELIIALDAGIVQAGGNGAEKSLNLGDSAWLATGEKMRLLKNESDREARLIYFVLKQKR